MTDTMNRPLSDAEIAWDALVAETGVTIECSEPRSHIEPTEKKEQTPGMPAVWISIEFDVVLRCGNASASTPFRMGTGHVDFGKAAKKAWANRPLYIADESGPVAPGPNGRVRFSIEEQHALNTLEAKPHAHLKDTKLHAAVAAKCAKLLDVKPRARDVLWHLFSDSREAHFDGCTFEEWASNFGYDVDSRKALALFETCKDIGARLVRLFGRPTCEKFLALESL